MQYQIYCTGGVFEERPRNTIMNFKLVFGYYNCNWQCINGDSRQRERYWDIVLYHSTCYCWNVIMKIDAKQHKKLIHCHKSGSCILGPKIVMLHEFTIQIE